MCAPVKSRNTAPRHSIDLVLGASHSRMNLTFLPTSASRVMAGVQLPASSPTTRLSPFLAQASSDTLSPACAVLAALPTHRGYRDNSSCEAGTWPRADVL